jgi:hypothetical protein
VPFGGENIMSAFTVPGYVRQPGESLRGHYFFGVGGDVFTALGIPLREGRFLTSGDYDQRVCVVDEDFARLYWPQGGAVGRRLFIGTSERPADEAFTVVGVVGATKQTESPKTWAKERFTFIPVPHGGQHFRQVRTRHHRSFGVALQKIVRVSDLELPVNDLRSMEVRIADSLLLDVHLLCSFLLVRPCCLRPSEPMGCWPTPWPSGGARLACGWR